MIVSWVLSQTYIISESYRLERFEVVWPQPVLHNMTWMLFMRNNNIAGKIRILDAMLIPLHNKSHEYVYTLYVPFY